MGNTSYDIGWSFISSRGCPDMELSTGLHHGNTLAYTARSSCAAQKSEDLMFSRTFWHQQREQRMSLFWLCHVLLWRCPVAWGPTKMRSRHEKVWSPCRNKKVESKIPTHLPVFRVASTHCLFHMLRQLSRLSCLSVWKSVLTNFNPKYM